MAIETGFNIIIKINKLCTNETVFPILSLVKVRLLLSKIV